MLNARVCEYLACQIPRKILFFFRDFIPRARVSVSVAHSSHLIFLNVNVSRV